jgi:hypothetical protein
MKIVRNLFSEVINTVESSCEVTLFVRALFNDAESKSDYTG